MEVLNTYGYRTCPFSLKNLNRSLEMLECHKIDGFAISSSEKENFKDVINKIPSDIKAIHMLGDFSLEQYLSLEKFRSLEFLSIDAKIIHFKNDGFPNLKIYLGVWPDAKGIPLSFKNLEILYADKIKVLEDSVLYFNSMKNLRNLTISRGNGVDLSDIECDLHEFTIGYCKNIKNVGKVLSSRKLKSLTIYNCPSLEFGGGVIEKLSNLEKLELTNIKSIDSLKFVENTPQIKILTFDGTPVIDKDISSLLLCESLVHLYGKNDPAFTPPLRTIEATVAKRL